MEKSTHSPAYDAFRATMKELRKASGLSQRELAAKLRREHSFVARVEIGDRRLDVVEFYWLCNALGKDPKRVFAGLADSFARIEKRKKKR